MDNFINEPIDTASLPRFEEVKLNPLQSSYYKVILFNIAVRYLIAGIVAGCALYFVEGTTQAYWYIALVLYIVLLLFSLFISRISFKNKGFAYRTHDVIYRSGAIAISTVIVPYNRVQHVALHEGWLSRRLGLARVEIFTAGGDSSDVKIPGLDKEHAESIKQLLMGKVLNIQEQHEE
ncbi:PH domain-containing protein [Flavobacterium sp.]|uniref:PH domain-containing protein n=1 Tax=Flavobacterium sp. TaxID=239 RepID=UPI002604C87C|nr:PH domain-containing protein [Flavobacterium sp.]